MTDCCDEDVRVPPFKKGSKRKDPPKEDEKQESKTQDPIKISESAQKKLKGEQGTKSKKAMLQELEENMRTEEKNREDEHNFDWFIDEEYIQELENRVKTCFKVKLPDPALMKIYECYSKNQTEPIKCYSLVKGFMGRMALERDRFMDRLKKKMIKLPPSGKNEKK